MLVLKFGGTSVGTPAALERIAAVLKDSRHSGNVGIVVVSAFSGVTDGLIAIAKEALEGGGWRERLGEVIRRRHYESAAYFLKGADEKEALSEVDAALCELESVLEGVSALGELSARTRDRVLSFGERLSSALIARIFRSQGIDAVHLDSRRVIKTDDNFGKARYLAFETEKAVREAVNTDGGRLYVASGFIGSTKDGAVTTLGRGGSDLSAAIYGAAAGAQAIEIWTDVDGIQTCDPKLVKNAFTIEKLSYTEAMELSHFGAKVLHPPTVLPALEKNIPIRVLNTFKSGHPGTLISVDEAESAWPVKGISSMNDISLVRLEGAGMAGAAGFAARFFASLSGRNINVILITQASSEHSICVAVLPEDAGAARDALSIEFAGEISSGGLEKPVIESGCAVIAAVGSKMKSTAGLSGMIFKALGRNGINVMAIAQGSSEINISLVISRRDTAKALGCIHDAFFLSGTRSVNLYLTGLGLIGGTLLEQIANQKDTLAAQYKITIKLAGIANSRKMLFKDDGIDVVNAKTLLEETGEDFNLDVFIERMKAANLPNTAFCDCTANADVASSYISILQASIPVITPNKKANSGPLSYYHKLINAARDRGVPYLYEVTVCAGLPVISTLRDLRLAGDTVQRIEAVLSGTLSFIFNNYDGSKPFSALVREAKAAGYTEPDPRDDLNAMDAARKALILARECGMPLEFSDVEIEPILPEACFKAKTLEDFWTELEKADAAFESRRAAAAGAGKALRYVAVVEAEGRARLALREEDGQSPFRSLVGADNIVVISSRRYSELPMVIKGPGAGAAVTAGAVFADIVRIAGTTG
ncbi:MAG: bifunctional aspartate kinase/homoserine dehydrogenase I [Spirochaetaceae bacterium]|jgi:aspartokinase/homoserine dehydrogenase 1|nr:bifunctional aspartate kinase/homoserine dehydrogenase I [Spirochaetaceae bacterium]